MKRAFALAALASLGSIAPPALAIPSFARKYATSCATCHTVYPKLTPFGEGFRRNAFRFPGVDSDYVKQDTVPLTPGGATTLPAVPPLAFGFNGQAILHPDNASSGGKADNGTGVSLQNLIAEAHLWAGGSFNDHTTFFGEVTSTSDGTVDLEHAQVYLADLFGIRNLANLRVGRGFSNVTSFGPHSSYVADALVPSMAVTALNGATSASWNVDDHYNGLELSGVVASGRVDYNVGWNAGTNVDVRNSEDVYGHVGFKLGGMRLDGEGASNTNAERPWEETALTLDAFAYHSFSGVNFPDPSGGPTPIFLQDTANVIGGGVRAQWGSLELSSGVYFEHHKRAAVDGTGADALTQYNELSYVVQPWLVPAVRVEYLSLSPDVGARVSTLRLMPGIASAVYPNVKLTLVADLESASGAPPAGWGPVGGLVAPTDITASQSLELEAVVLGVAFAF